MSIQEPVNLSAFKPECPAPPRLHWLWLVLAIPVPIYILNGLRFHYEFRHFQQFHTASPANAFGEPWTAFVFLMLSTGWIMLQILWFRKIFPHTRAFPLYLVYIGLRVVSVALFEVAIHNKMPMSHPVMVSIIVFAIYTCASLVFRSELQMHYNEAEPIGLKLNLLMTILFPLYYFQYHFWKIALLKDEAAAIPVQPTA